MNEEIKSVLRFENYIVKKVLFEYNLQYNNEEAIDIKFDVDADYCVNEEDGSNNFHAGIYHTLYFST